MRRLLRLAIVTTALLAVGVEAAPAEVSVTLSTSHTRVSVNDAFSLSVSVEGALNVPSPDLGAIEERFSVRASGSSTNMSFVNGRMTQSKSFSYTLLPREAGAFTLGPASVVVDGTEYRSNTVEIDVVEGGAPAAATEPEIRQSSQSSDGRDVFVTTSVDRRTAFVDEQITLSFKYYRRAEPFRQPSYEPPDLTGFWVEDLDERDEYIEVVDGKRYRVTELKTALFGASAGKAVVGPATLVYHEDGPAFTFFTTRGQRRTLRTDPVEIEIRPLPEDGRPADFEGAVGRYRLTSSLDAESVAVGDPVTMTVTISGEGNIRTVSAPDLSGLDGFRVYESGSSTEVTRKNGKVGGVKRYEFVLVPESEGTRTVPPVELVYFDPVEERYRRTGSAERVVEVTPGADDGGLPVARAGVARVGEDIRYIRETPSTLRFPGEPLHERPWFALLQLVGPLWLVAAVLARRRATELGGNPRLSRYRAAAGRAREVLRAAEASLANGRLEEGCSGVARALTDFIGDRTGTSARGLTLAEIGELLRGLGASEDLRRRVDRTLRACDAARFAGDTGGGEPSGLVSQARDCIRELTILTPKPPGKEGGRGSGSGSGASLLLVLALCLAGAVTCSAQSDPGAAPSGSLEESALEPASEAVPGVDSMSSDEALSLYREGNARYADGRYGQAAERYERVISGGYGVADVQYNLGNARYKQGELGRAVLAYERALRLEPGHEDARANLTFVRERLPDRQAPIDDGPLAAFARGVVTGTRISAIEALGSALFLLACATLALGILRGRVVGWPLRATVTLAVLFVIVAGVLGVRLHIEETRADGIVLADELLARAGPGEDFVLEFTVHEGTAVATQDEREEWTRITLPGTDLVGWVRSDGLEMI